MLVEDWGNALNVGDISVKAEFMAVCVHLKLSLTVVLNGSF